MRTLSLHPERVSRKANIGLVNFSLIKSDDDDDDDGDDDDDDDEIAYFTVR